MKILIIIAVFIVLYVIWQVQELKKFTVTEYVTESHKTEKEYTAVLIADLHGYCYGKNNGRLLQSIAKASPDLILIAGDMVVSKNHKTYDTALSVLAELKKMAPVYYALGNHEQRVSEPASAYYDMYKEYEKKVTELGICILENQTVNFSKEVKISGLKIPLSCYRKGKSVPLPKGFLIQNLGEMPQEQYHILLAHNPVFAQEYADWGADLSVCGHYHGGLLRIPGVGSLISPQFKLFPKYDGGNYAFGTKRVVVSRGLGTHTFHIRIFNRAELVVIRIKPQDIAKNELK